MYLLDAIEYLLKSQDPIFSLCQFINPKSHNWFLIQKNESLLIIRLFSLFSTCIDNAVRTQCVEKCFKQKMLIRTEIATYRLLMAQSRNYYNIIHNFKCLDISSITRFLIGYVNAYKGLRKPKLISSIYLEENCICNSTIFSAIVMKPGQVTCYEFENLRTKNAYTRSDVMKKSVCCFPAVLSSFFVKQWKFKISTVFWETWSLATLKIR